ncbi:hypothetical protein [Haematobacter genomosp. 1]|uniref:hypothetical protein n=1 Tax=Haematobacter genomosp. 1 TaxID=366618 RepID=UPI00117BBD9F|nr:hypothetical protein [Haematobacter genomosp. 1]
MNARSNSSWSGIPPAARLRLCRAETLCLAIGDCDPEDAAAICAGFLDRIRSPGPQHDAFGFVYGEATLWAEAAPPHEVAAYGLAALRSLQSRALGLDTRKRLLAALWSTLPPKERAAFLATVNTGGQA